jgi:hypothetical protein
MVEDARGQIITRSCKSWLPIAATRRKSRPIQPAAPDCSKSRSHYERVAAAMRSWERVRPPRRGPAEMAHRLRANPNCGDAVIGMGAAERLASWRVSL